MWRRLFTKLPEEEELQRAQTALRLLAAAPSNAKDVLRMVGLITIWVLDSLSSEERHLIIDAMTSNLYDAYDLPKPTMAPH